LEGVADGYVGSAVALGQLSFRRTQGLREPLQSPNFSQEDSAMVPTALEIELAHLDAAWVVLGFGIDDVMDKLPGMIRRLGPHSIWFPQTTAMLLGVPPQSKQEMAYILVADHDEEEAAAAAARTAGLLEEDGLLAIIISFGTTAARMLDTNDGVIQIIAARPSDVDERALMIAALLMTLCGNGLIGVDLQDIRTCLLGPSSVAAWLWRGRDGQSVAETVAQVAALRPEYLPPHVTGAVSIPIIPPNWTLGDVVEMADSVSVSESVDLALAAFTDDGPNPLSAMVVFTRLAVA
jgi:hypothetical protein